MGKITTINLEDSVHDYIKRQTNNISRFVNNLIKEKMETKEEKIKQLKNHIKDTEKEIEELEKHKISEEKRKADIIKDLSDEKKEELKDAIKSLSNKPYYFEGRYNRYKNMFENITKEEYKELLELFNNNK